MNCVVPCVEKKWKPSEPTAFKHAKREALNHGSVRFTGRTFHSATDWCFEFEIVEKNDIDQDALERADILSHQERGY